MLIWSFRFRNLENGHRYPKPGFTLRAAKNGGTEAPVVINSHPKGTLLAVTETEERIEDLDKWTSAGTATRIIPLAPEELDADVWLGVIDNPLTLVTSWMIFLGLTVDVQYTHLLGNVDESIHHMVDAELRADPSGSIRAVAQWLSEVPIYIALAGLIGGSVASTIPLLKGGGEGGEGEGAVQRFVLLTSWYFLGGGAVLHSDPVLVNVLKHSVGRIRPNPYYGTFSYPSGHSTAAWCMAGAALFFVLPTFAASFRIKTGNGNERPQHVGRSLCSLWFFFGITVMFGRILADVHWFTDTLGGASLGISLTLLLRQIDKRWLSR